jgi:hypothetical protein
VENLVLLKHCGASISLLPSPSWIPFVPSFLESVWEMVRSSVYERAGLKPCAYHNKVDIQAHKA